ncbi:MAG: helix-turn-helix domain-containing protein [Nitrospira sp.]|nr:helix-turn-helix domain-containing protein [Nitrospira sp.]
METTEKLLSLTEAADRLHITRQALHTALTEGKIPAQQVGRQWVLREADVDAYNPRAYRDRRPKAPLLAQTGEGKRGE